MPQYNWNPNSAAKSQWIRTWEPDFRKSKTDQFIFILMQIIKTKQNGLTTEKQMSFKISFQLW